MIRVRKRQIPLPIYLVDAYLSGTIDEVYAFYNHSKNLYEQVPAMWKIMPINMNMFFEQRMAGNAQGIADQDPQLKQLQGYINYEPSRESGAEVNCFLII